MINLEFTNKDLHKSIEDKVNEGFFEHEKSHGIYDEYEKFHIIAKLDKEVVGVLSGYTVFAEIYIDNFWIEKNHRKKLRQKSTQKTQVSKSLKRGIRYSSQSSCSIYAGWYQQSSFLCRK